jgi:hypothetical protein
MIVAVGALLLVLVTSLMATLPARGKKTTGLPIEPIKHSPKKKLIIRAIGNKEEPIKQSKVQTCVLPQDHQIETRL